MKKISKENRFDSFQANYLRMFAAAEHPVLRSLIQIWDQILQFCRWKTKSTMGGNIRAGNPGVSDSTEKSCFAELKNITFIQIEDLQLKLLMFKVAESRDRDQLHRPF